MVGSSPPRASAPDSPPPQASAPDSPPPQASAPDSPPPQASAPDSPPPQASALNSDPLEPPAPLPGIVYLGHIPPRMRPKTIRNLLSGFGEIGRIFLQPEDGDIRKKKRKAGSNARNFTEGWVEFRNKRMAKLVSRSLNNTRIGAKKRSIFHDDLWCMKYLHRFRWIHLSERLAYERLVRGQRMRAEVSQVKRESNFILQNVEKSSNMEHLRKIKQQKGQEWQEKSWHFTQRQTEQEIQQSKAGKIKRRKLEKMAEIQSKSESNISLLAKIFNPPIEQE